MRVVLAVIACAAAIVAANPTPPTFPLSWSATEDIYVLENGGTDTVAQTSYWQQDSQFNRTAQQVVGTAGPTLVSVISDFVQEIDYYIQGGLCQYTCSDMTEICDGQDSLCTYDYINSAKFAGVTVMDGEKVNEYSWMEGIGPIPMNALQLYVDAATNSVPVFQYRDLEPFGNQAGYVNTTFTDYTVGTPAASVFNVPGIQYCADGGDQCPDSAATPLQRRLHKVRFLARAAAEARLDQMNGF